MGCKRPTLRGSSPRGCATRGRNCASAAPASKRSVRGSRPPARNGAWPHAHCWRPRQRWRRPWLTPPPKGMLPGPRLRQRKMRSQRPLGRHSHPAQARWLLRRRRVRLSMPGTRQKMRRLRPEPRLRPCLRKGTLLAWRGPRRLKKRQRQWHRRRMRSALLVRCTRVRRQRPFGARLPRKAASPRAKPRLPSSRRRPRRAQRGRWQRV
mmetsp:Transcript_47482/g.132384  ORF Transcript_47482/g.132384 Transcript_47482/m.132384 type:complete len:208 (-) Transcript_47482:533-1156(-)